MAYTDRITSEHADRPKFMALVEAMTGSAQSLTDFAMALPQLFDLDEASGVQLDAVGEWVGQSRGLTSPIDDVYFSWDTDGVGWDEGVWKRVGDPSSGVTELDDTTFRLLLRAKIEANHWDGSMEKTVTILQKIFGPVGLTASITDNQNMTMTITIAGAGLPAIYKAIINGGYLPIKPMGVRVIYVLP
ncbi:bacteriophage protein [Rhodanobacter fulvus Jip2]|uniref:Bacteriophage protein n=1 Tax=Rhodanobacter fulvus Jip2 TaxID=1163408 RepID=I4VMS7_9GAMM|nr:DUF2612 domain-containing protein [Rhodanobacter fulvus]EIL88518.1 bacteriophage protein [Rhodanobacter fulvus Jip2]